MGKLGALLRGVVIGVTILLLCCGVAGAEVVPCDEMTLVSVDSEEVNRGNNLGTNAIDGDLSTIWHTEWYDADPVHPHEIVIDLGYDRQVCGFSYLPRQDGSYNGGIAAYEFYVSTDDQNWGNPVATGVFPRTSDKQEVAFDARHARYVRLVALSEVAGHAWTTVAEIEVIETVEQVDIVEVVVEVMWSRPENAGDWAGLWMRVNGDDSTIIDITDPEPTTWVGTLVLSVEENVFEVLAYDAGGQHSEWSEPAYFTPAEILHAPMGVSVRAVE